MLPGKTNCPRRDWGGALLARLRVCLRGVASRAVDAKLDAAADALKPAVTWTTMPPAKS